MTIDIKTCRVDVDIGEWAHWWDPIVHCKNAFRHGKPIELCHKIKGNE